MYTCMISHLKLKNHSGQKNLISTCLAAARCQWVRQAHAGVRWIIWPWHRAFLYNNKPLIHHVCEYISDVCRKELKRGTKRPGVTMYVKYKFEICSSHALYITIYFMFIFIYLIFSSPADWVKEAGLTEPPTIVLFKEHRRTSVVDF